MTLPLRLSDRSFQLWAYTVSHAQLLLRSNKTDRHPRRLEILFRDVASIDLPTRMEGLEVAAATPEQAAPIRSRLGEARVGYRTVYVLRSGGHTGYVVAGLLTAHEDDGSYYTPSSLFEPGGL